MLDRVESLPDNLFGSCTALTRLILEHTSGICSVTDHTFDGAAPCYTIDFVLKCGADKFSYSIN